MQIKRQSAVRLFQGGEHYVLNSMLFMCQKTLNLNIKLLASLAFSFRASQKCADVIVKLIAQFGLGLEVPTFVVVVQNIILAC